jgi:hypothetical protein
MDKFIHSQFNRWDDRYKFIQEGLQYLYFNASSNERDDFKRRAAIEENEAKIADKAISDIKYGVYKLKLSKDGYPLSKEYKPFNLYDRDSVEDGSHNRDYEEKIHKNYKRDYRFGKALQAFKTSKCPTTYQYTPIMYDDRDVMYHESDDDRDEKKNWPWDENEKWEDPIVNPIGGKVYCCNKTTKDLDPIYVDTKNNLFRLDHQNCGKKRYLAYKYQETRFVKYINTYMVKNYRIFECITSLINGVKNFNQDTIFFVLQTYYDFFRDPLRIKYFEDCVCRGNEGHQHIQQEIQEITYIVKKMLFNYGLTGEDQDEIIGENGILTKLAEYINTENPDWKENTLLTLRRWLSFNMRIEKRIKDEGKDEGKKVKLSEQPFYEIIKYVIQYLLEHLQNSTDAIPLLQLMPNMEKSEPVAPMSSFNDINFDAVLSYLLKDTSSRTALHALGSRLKLGLKCNAEEIFTVFIRIALRSQKIAKLLLQNLLRDYGNKCKEHLKNILNTNEDVIKNQIIQMAYEHQPKEFQDKYKNGLIDKKKWKADQLLLYVILKNELN